MYTGKLKVGDKIRTDASSIPTATVVKVSSGQRTAHIVGHGMTNWVISRTSTKLGWGSDNYNGEIWLEVSTNAVVSFASVVLDDDRKYQIKAAISQLENAEKIFTKWGFGEIFEKGTAVTLLFWGIPGTGKTLMAQAVSDYLKYELKVYQTADIESSEPGGAERAIRQIFKDSVGKKEVILFDECDSLLMDRNEIGPILGAQVNALLTEIEHFDGVIVFTTNRLGKLDPALERRITTKVEFPFPDITARKAIWLRMIPKKAPLAPDVDFDRLAEYPLTGGNIKNAVLTAARTAVYEKKENIAMQDFVYAIEKESEALQNFVAEFEKQTHQHIVGEDYGRDTSSIRIEKKKEMRVGLSEALKESFSKNNK